MNNGANIHAMFLYSLGGLLESDVVGEATDLAGDPLHALLALDDGAVDVVHALDHVGQRVGSYTRKRRL